MVDAARRLFVDQGYVPTTVRQVADLAGVSPQTVYAAFDTKSGLFTRVFDIAIVGDDEPVPLAEREPLRRAMAAETRPAALAGYSAACRATYESYAPLYPVLLAGAATDPALADYHRTNVVENRRRGMRFVAEQWHRRGWVTADLDEAADAMWTLCSPEVYVALTVQLDWAADHYETWLARMLDATLTG